MMMVTLPREMWLAIIDVLDPSDVQSFRQTCFFFYDLCHVRRLPTAIFLDVEARFSAMLADFLARLDRLPCLCGIAAKIE